MLNLRHLPLEEAYAGFLFEGYPISRRLVTTLEVSFAVGTESHTVESVWRIQLQSPWGCQMRQSNNECTVHTFLDFFLLSLSRHNIGKRWAKTKVKHFIPGLQEILQVQDSVLVPKLTCSGRWKLWSLVVGCWWPDLYTRNCVLVVCTRMVRVCRRLLWRVCVLACASYTDAYEVVFNGNSYPVPATEPFCSSLYARWRSSRAVHLTDALDNVKLIQTYNK